MPVLATATAIVAVVLGIGPHASETGSYVAVVVFMLDIPEKDGRRPISEELSSQQAGNGLSGTEEVRFNFRREKRGDKQNVLGVLKITCKGGEKKKRKF